MQGKELAVNRGDGESDSSLQDSWRDALRRSYRVPWERRIRRGGQPSLVSGEGEGAGGKAVAVARWRRKEEGPGTCEGGLGHARLCC